MMKFFDYLKWRSIQNMGHMKFWWIFGYEDWGLMRPANCISPQGVRYVPLILGLWLRQDKE